MKYPKEIQEIRDLGFDPFAHKYEKNIDFPMGETGLNQSLIGMFPVGVAQFFIISPSPVQG